MRAGRMRHTITVECKADIVSPSGAVRSAWTHVETVRAELVSWSASEFARGYGEAETGTVVLRVRRIPGITTADRITHNGVAHDLKEIVEIDNGRALELRAVATR